MKNSRSKSFNPRRLASSLFLILAIAAVATWYIGSGGGATRPPANSLMVISPYDYDGTWVFDDSRYGLVREPFVAGVPEMIDLLVADVPDAKQGFRLLFSAKPFPGYQKKLTRTRGNADGNYYQLDDPPMEGWICPALFKYYEAAPEELYVKAEPKT